MSEQLIKKTISRDAPFALAIREMPWYYKRTDRRSITYEWWCRECISGNSFEDFNVEPTLELVCIHCGMKIKRDEVGEDWYYFKPAEKTGG